MELWIENGFPRPKVWGDMLDAFFLGPAHESSGRIVPAADVTEDDRGYHFWFEMPGLAKESIDVRVENDSLVVEAERKRPQSSDEIKVHHAGRRYGKIRRRFLLAEDANREEVQAAYADGVLAVTVGKRPEAKPVKVKVAYEN